MDEIINKFTKKSEDKPTSLNSSKFDELYNKSAILEKHKQFVKPRLTVSIFYLYVLGGAYYRIDTKSKDGFHDGYFYNPLNSKSKHDHT